MANTLALIRFPEFDRWAARKIDALDGWTISQAARERFFGQEVRWNSTCFVSSCDFLRGISKYLRYYVGNCSIWFQWRLILDLERFSIDIASFIDNRVEI